MGGEVSGNVDNYIRDANSCLSNIHFPATELAASRLRTLLQDASRVFRTGCPSVDLAARAASTDIGSWSLEGVGDSIDLTQPFAIVMLHAVTGEESEARVQAHILASQVASLPLQFVWFWPNSDPGSQQITRFIRSLRESGDLPIVRFIKNLPPSAFLALLAKSSLIVGNSSAAIREGAFLGVPAVNIGSRQQARERGPNVVDADWSASSLASALAVARAMGRAPSSTLYGSGDAGEQIARHLHDQLCKAP
jgi:UDP-hydrolysing UDP-N-acetyl-D-glucosamine 2-epimerase